MAQPVSLKQPPVIHGHPVSACLKPCQKAFPVKVKPEVLPVFRFDALVLKHVQKPAVTVLLHMPQAALPVPVKPHHPVPCQVHLSVSQGIFQKQLIDPGLPDIGVLQFLEPGDVLKPSQYNLRTALLIGQDLQFHGKPAVFPIPVLKPDLTPRMVPSCPQDTECLQEGLLKSRMHHIRVRPHLRKSLYLLLRTVCDLAVRIDEGRPAGHIVLKDLFPAHIHGPPLHLFQVRHILVIPGYQDPPVRKLAGPARTPHRNIPPLRVVPCILDLTQLTRMDNPVHDIIYICMVSPVDTLVPKLKTRLRGHILLCPQQPGHGPVNIKFHILHILVCHHVPQPQLRHMQDILYPVHIMKYKAFGEILIFHSFSSSVCNIPAAKYYLLSYHCMKGALSVFY